MFPLMQAYIHDSNISDGLLAPVVFAGLYSAPDADCSYCSDSKTGWQLTGEIVNTNILSTIRAMEIFCTTRLQVRQVSMNVKTSDGGDAAPLTTD